MNHLILLLIATALSSYSHAQSNPFLTEMQTRLENSKKYTLAVATAMPESTYGYKPAADEMTFGGQLLHMAQNITWLTSTHLTTNPNPLTEADLKNSTASKAAVEEIVAKAFDYAIAAVHDFDPANLDESVKFFSGPLSKRQIMLLINDHQTHHRGQLVVYLRLNSIKPPDYVGW